MTAVDQYEVQLSKLRILEDLCGHHSRVVLKEILGDYAYMNEHAPIFFIDMKEASLTITRPEEITLLPETIPEGCYEACFDEYAMNPGGYSLWLGFASHGYHDDEYGAWYMHAWLVDNKTNKIVEGTPAKRKLYYGFRVSDDKLPVYEQALLGDPITDE